MVNFQGTTLLIRAHPLLSAVYGWVAFNGASLLASVGRGLSGRKLRRVGPIGPADVFLGLLAFVVCGLLWWLLGSGLPCVPCGGVPGLPWCPLRCAWGFRVLLMAAFKLAVHARIPAIAGCALQGLVAEGSAHFTYRALLLLGDVGQVSSSWSPFRRRSKQ